MPPSGTPATPARTLGRRLAAALLAAWVLLPAGAVAATRLVAVGDVHGALPAYREVLRAADLLDDAGRWSGGDAWLVQVGDLIDRGPELRAAFDFAIELEAQAAAAGGRYVQLLGNHEVMNLTGDLRYVTEENFADFADADSETRRDEAWREFRDWHRRRSERLGIERPRLGSAARREWMAAHPPGWLEHREAFGPEGRYGRWLRARPTLVTIDGTLLVHGGLDPSTAELGAAAVDARVHREIRRLDELRAALAELDVVVPYFDLPDVILACRDELAALERDAEAGAAAEPASPSAALCGEIAQWESWSIHSSDGPLWFRGYDRWSDAEVASELPALRAAFGVDRFVVGHTPQPNGTVRMRGDGGIFLVDTGMLASYVPGGRGSALEVAEGVVTAIYPGEERQVLWHGAATAASVGSTLLAADEGTAAPAAEPAAQPSVRDENGRPFVGPDGALLPFADDDALLEFLANAPVVEVKEVGEGITRPRRLTLERDGVRVRGLFQTVHEQRRIVQVAPGRREANFRDFHGFEPAAYRLGRLLGLANIPPSIGRRFDGDLGSIQLWIENAMREKDRAETGATPPDSLRWKRRLQVQLVWDQLIGNTDRNAGNFLYDSDWRLWMIDHSRAFRTSNDLIAAEKIIWCERGLYERLRSLSDDEIRAAVDEALRPNEIRALLARRKKLVDHLEGLIRARGEATVLFEWTK